MEDYSLFDLEKDYYLGNYQSCVNKANSMPVSRESLFYLCLSYYHLKKFDILNLEMSKSNDKCVQLIGLLVRITQNPSDHESIIDELDSMLEDKTLDLKDDLSMVVVSSIYVKKKLYPNALRVLHHLDTLPVLFAQVNIFILMNRVDLAERQLKLMQSKDDYATITLLATAQVKLSKGAAREAYDIAKELEDKYRATPLLKNIQTSAAILDGDLDGAKLHCESSLDLDNDNLEALINMIHIISKSKSTTEIKDRHFDRLKTLYPDHEFVKEIDDLSSSLNEISTMKTPPQPLLRSVEKSKGPMTTPEPPKFKTKAHRTLDF